jgi:hypothetical protein
LITWSAEPYVANQINKMWSHLKSVEPLVHLLQDGFLLICWKLQLTNKHSSGWPYARYSFLANFPYSRKLTYDISMLCCVQSKLKNITYSHKILCTPTIRDHLDTVLCGGILCEDAFLKGLA